MIPKVFLNNSQNIPSNSQKTSGIPVFQRGCTRILQDAQDSTKGIIEVQMQDGSTKVVPVLLGKAVWA